MRVLSFSSFLLSFFRSRFFFDIHLSKDVTQGVSLLTKKNIQIAIYVTYVTFVNAGDKKMANANVLTDDLLVCRTASTERSFQKLTVCTHINR